MMKSKRISISLLLVAASIVVLLATWDLPDEGADVPTRAAL